MRTARVVENFSDLGVAADTCDAPHSLAELNCISHPIRFAALATAIKRNLNFKTADGRCLTEHFGLQLTGLIPRRLPRHGRIQREDESAGRIVRGESIEK